MPETYSHTRTYEQITGRSRNTWKRPEPSPTPKERILADFVVDEATYRKYDRMTWDLGDGVNRSIYGVRLYATSAEIAENYPELAARAKELYAQIGKEIYTKDDGKEDENMSKPRTAADFIDALNDIYADSLAAYEAMHAKVAAAKEKAESARESVREPMGQAIYEVALAECKLAEETSRKEYRDLIADHGAKVKELRDTFSTYLAECYSASPDKLDAATMQLLESGICTPSELVQLVDRHHDNPTMLRIIGSHAQRMKKANEKNISQDDMTKYFTVIHAAYAAKDGKRELAIFDSAAACLPSGLGENPQVAKRMREHITGWMGEFRNQIVNLPVVPAETAAADNGSTQ